MKTAAKTLAMLILVGFFASSCATVSRLNAEYEEEMTRVEKMSPEEKAEWEKARDEKAKIHWDEYGAGGDND